jgi:hypothetical protein
MKIRISEVWNNEGRSEELTIIETRPSEAKQAVFSWITAHRPDLSAAGIFGHGFHAVQVND